MSDTGYKHEGDPILLTAGQQWPACPTSYLSDPNFAAALGLYQSAQVSPLAGWPNAYAAWSHRMVCDIHDTIETIKAKAMED